MTKFYEKGLPTDDLCPDKIKRGAITLDRGPNMMKGGTIRYILDRYERKGGPSALEWAPEKSEGGPY